MSYAIKEQLKFDFGRLWPETWVDGNPSWIKDAAYGFFPFHGRTGWSSFPSGHMTAITAPVSVLWARLPRWRPVLAIPVILVAVGLYGADFHFIGDMVAGCCLGAACGIGVLAVLRRIGRLSSRPTTDDGRYRVLARVDADASAMASPRNPPRSRRGSAQTPRRARLRQHQRRRRLRAAVASGAVLVVNIWLQSPALLFAAFAANLTCFCDTGGALRDRIPALVGFTLIGAALWSGFGLLHDFGLPILLPAAALVIFCNSMARVWGVRAQAVGNVMTVVLALAVDRPLTLPEAGVLFVSFIAGGAWAILLTIGIWRIYPDRAVTRLVAANWRLLALFSRDLVPLLATGSDSSSSGRRMRALTAGRCGTRWRSPARRSSMRCVRPARSRRSRPAIC